MKKLVKLFIDLIMLGLSIIELVLWICEFKKDFEK